ncbi:MAG: DUF305 domain-containing protein, partial [Gemmatimonadetes bacterium]|nr:DUF305 domain-containing protein [Gemmatimonadota bacterium]
MLRTTVRHPWAVALVFAAGCASSAGPGAPGPTAGPPEIRSADPVVVQPGAPGQATRTVENAALGMDELPAVSEADVRFMQGMIPHHAQALVMTDLVRRNSRSDAIRQ